MNREETEYELRKSEEWFRDRLNDYLQYGLGAFVIFAGWLLSSDSIISLSNDAEADKKEAAVMLAIILPILWLIWYVILLKTHSRCPPHETIIKRLYLHLYALGVALSLFTFWLMVADIFKIFDNR
jgi:RsiW-degrading membrane proteinase PrsW (M82 family)